VVSQQPFESLESGPSLSPPFSGDIIEKDPVGEPPLVRHNSAPAKSMLSRGVPGRAVFGNRSCHFGRPLCAANRHFALAIIPNSDGINMQSLKEH